MKSISKIQLRGVCSVYVVLTSRKKIYFQGNILPINSAKQEIYSFIQQEEALLKTHTHIDSQRQSNQRPFIFQRELATSADMSNSNHWRLDVGVSSDFES